jgi:tetratricopeptide (TPR) repeat protein
MYYVLTPTDFAEYLQQIKQASSYESIHPCCLRKLVEGAVAYARDLGFAPHSDYAVAAQLFGNIDAAACPVTYTYGKDGKPFYIRGPNDPPARYRKILETLNRKLGPGNYDYLIETDVVNEPQPQQSVQLHYSIVEGPIENPGYDQLPKAIQDELEELYLNKLRSHTRQAIVTLKSMIEQYPTVPTMYNYLYAAYKLIGNKAAAKRTLDLTVQQFPDYLFGKIGQIEECLHEGRLDEIQRILNNKYDLKLLYPDRNEFHISEFVSFNAVMAWYFHELGKSEDAKMYYEALKKVAPNDRRTKLIQQKLFPSSSLSLLSGVFNKLLPWRKR